MENEKYCPEDPSLSLQRPVGYWANQLLKDYPVYPGPRRCLINYVSEIVPRDGHMINIDHFKEAVRATIYNQPHLRTDVDMETEPARWVPAVDFSDVFVYVDLRKEEVRGLKGVWNHVENEANREWQYGSGKPLYRCTLLHAVDCYVVMNCYHHAAADGTSGTFILDGIMQQYNRIVHGKSVTLSPSKPRPPVEECTLQTSDSVLVEQMVSEKEERIKSYKPYLPLEMPSHVGDGSRKTFNHTIIEDGDAEKYKAVRTKCKAMQVTVGSLSLAASYLALAAVHAKETCSDLNNYAGMKDQYIDIPVNIRPRVDPPIEDNHCGFYVTEVATKMSIDLDTTLWGLAKEIGQELQSQFSANRHLSFSRAKYVLETGQTKELASSLKPEHIVDLLLSNMRAYPFETHFSWGDIKTLHVPGSLWTPGFSNYLILIGATDRFHYDMVHLRSSRNSQIAKDVLSFFCKIMEDLSHSQEDIKLRDIVHLF